MCINHLGLGRHLLNDVDHCLPVLPVHDVSFPQSLPKGGDRLQHNNQLLVGGVHLALHQREEIRAVGKLVISSPNAKLLQAPPSPGAPSWPVGTPVWLFDPNCPKGEFKKLRNPWAGPWLIQSVDTTRQNATILRHDRPKPRKVHWNRPQLYKAPLAPLEKKLTGRRKEFVYGVHDSLMVRPNTWLDG